MAKLTLSPIGSFSQAAITTINQNMADISTAVEKTLSRDGTTPNQMSADLDMNNKNVLNVGTVATTNLTIGGVIAIPSSISGGTPQAILDAIKTVDGAGSGLDADMVDGKHANAFLTIFNIEAYGASPAASPATNDTAIAAAIAAASSAGGGKVYVPAKTYVHDLTVPMASGVELFGDGDLSVLKSNTLASVGLGHIHVDCRGKSHWSIHDLSLDASGVTPFTTGMRSINCDDTTHDYAVERVLFKTPGAAVASIGSYNYRIANNRIEIISTDGVHHHDGIIDQWAGAHDFDVVGNRIVGNGIGRYGILVTGETTLSVAAGCYNFRIHNNDVSNVQQVGIWLNGRGGINNHFSVCNNRVDTVSLFHGIGIADCDYGVVDGNLVNAPAYVGLFLYSEGGSGVTGCRHVTATNNIITNANTLGLGSASTGSGITLTSSSIGCIIDNNRVKGTTQTYSLYVDNTTTYCVIGGANNFDAGTTGTISYGTSTTNTKVPTLNSANTWTAAQTIDVPAAGVAFTLQGDDSGAVYGPGIDLYRHSASPAAFDQGGIIYASFDNSSAARLAYGFIAHVAQAVTAGAESGAWDFQTRRSGTLASRMVLGNGLYTANATGGDKGADTINAVNYYINGTVISSLYLALTGGTVTGALLTSSVAGLGYATGAGAGNTVTQITSKATGVTINKPTGQITMNNAALAAGAKVSFVVTNSAIAAVDVIIACVSGGGTADAYRVAVTAIAAGSFHLTVENITAGSLSESPVINFALIKGSTT